MSMNNTPSAERVHIGIFGRRNAGKSSIINALTGQSLAIVSDVLGTTTDPVLKAMELLPLGPVVMIDTPGLDDEGSLGALRVQKAYQILNKTDIALLIMDAFSGLDESDLSILKRIQEKEIPYLLVFNKCDQINGSALRACEHAIPSSVAKEHVLFVSAKNGEGIFELKEKIARLVPSDNPKLRIVGDLLKPLDLVLLVIPIDKAAPKGRLILPQQQTIRDILEANALSLVIKEHQLKETFALLKQKPALVITDSQAFKRVASDTPKDIPLTSFSILFARYKGNLKALVRGAKTLDDLKDGDCILISEGCTHHRQCDDIGSVKLPNWIREYSGKDLHFAFSSGTEFPLDLSAYRMIIHCGGCTLNEREVKYRLKCAKDAGVPMTNYGTAIAYIHGILERSIEIFSDEC